MTLVVARPHQSTQSKLSRQITAISDGVETHTAVLLVLKTVLFYFVVSA